MNFFNTSLLAIITLILVILNGCVEDQSDRILTFKDFAGWKNCPSGVNKSLNAIYFVNKDNGWIVGKDGIILHSNDGGKSWQKQISGTDEMLNAVYFLNEKIGWIVGGSKRNGKIRSPFLAMTEDGGANWKRSNLIYREAVLTDIIFTDSLNGWISGYTRDSTFILKSNDGGSSWQTNFSAISDRIILDIDFTDNNCIWAGGDNIIIFSGDNGQSWYKFSIPYVLTSLQCNKCSDGWAAGWGTIIRKYNLNSDTLYFQSQVSPIVADFYDVTFINSSTGWVVGSGGTILYTLNGGNNWDFLKSDLGYSFFKIFFIDELNGWLIGDKGMIFRTSSGGLSP